MNIQDFVGENDALVIWFLTERGVSSRPTVPMNPRHATVDRRMMNTPPRDRSTREYRAVDLIRENFQAPIDRAAKSSMPT